MIARIAIFLFLIMMIVINFASYKYIRLRPFTTIYPEIVQAYLKHQEGNE
ncbi:Uncharacterised protein [Anaerostipes hadrus]|uniref:Uncharacterized protein n=1 Tax=Anaerostipes hadrus TaxID=649756 RepID=A0A174JFI4_ANAHA|nr:hypothetical protein [Anaerostipes hadrus]CUO96976.1 Uncharacterised protein [Anaerostipes hadrus]